MVFVAIKWWENFHVINRIFKFVSMYLYGFYETRSDYFTFACQWLENVIWTCFMNIIWKRISDPLCMFCRHNFVYDSCDQILCHNVSQFYGMAAKMQVSFAINEFICRSVILLLHLIVSVTIVSDFHDVQKWTWCTKHDRDCVECPMTARQSRIMCVRTLSNALIYFHQTWIHVLNLKFWKWKVTGSHIVKFYDKYLCDMISRHVREWLFTKLAQRVLPIHHYEVLYSIIFFRSKVKVTGVVTTCAVVAYYISQIPVKFVLNRKKIGFDRGTCIKHRSALIFKISFGN